MSILLATLIFFEERARCISLREAIKLSRRWLAPCRFGDTVNRGAVSGDSHGPLWATDSDLRASSETPISFTLMIHHVVLYKLKPEVTPARVEAMMMNTRMQLLKIPEVLSIKCGKRIDPELPWPFFIAIDFESMDKYANLPRRPRSS